MDAIKFGFFSCWLMGIVEFLVVGFHLGRFSLSILQFCFLGRWLRLWLVEWIQNKVNNESSNSQVFCINPIFEKVVNVWTLRLFHGGCWVSFGEIQFLYFGVLFYWKVDLDLAEWIYQSYFWRHNGCHRVGDFFKMLMGIIEFWVVGTWIWVNESWQNEQWEFWSASFLYQSYLCKWLQLRSVLMLVNFK
jgi:hypothetical protein